MDETSMRLPIRLLPRKRKAILRALFFLFFASFSVFWIAMASQGVRDGHVQGEPFAGFRYVFPLFGIPFVLVGFGGLIGAIIKLLPGSPYYYVEITPQDIATRAGWKRRRFAWADLSPFGVSEKTRRGKNGSTTTYWVVALRAADGARLAYESERYNRSVLQINAGDYSSTDADMAAPVLADWLTQLRNEAAEHAGHLDVVPVPPDFRDAAIQISVGRAAMSIPAAARRSSVIER